MALSTSLTKLTMRRNEMRKMGIQALTNRLRELESFSDRHEIKGMQEMVERDEYKRKRAEAVYQEWLEQSYPDAKKYGVSPITEHEKLMWIEGYKKGAR